MPSSAAWCAFRSNPSPSAWVADKASSCRSSRLRSPTSTPKSTGRGRARAARPRQHERQLRQSRPGARRDPSPRGGHPPLRVARVPSPAAGQAERRGRPERHVPHDPDQSQFPEPRPRGRRVGTVARGARRQGAVPTDRGSRERRDGGLRGAGQRRARRPAGESRRAVRDRRSHRGGVAALTPIPRRGDRARAPLVARRTAVRQCTPDRPRRRRPDGGDGRLADDGARSRPGSRGQRASMAASPMPCVICVPSW